MLNGWSNVEKPIQFIVLSRNILQKLQFEKWTFKLQQTVAYFNSLSEKYCSYYNVIIYQLD